MLSMSYTSIFLRTKTTARATSSSKIFYVNRVGRRIFVSRKTNRFYEGLTCV